VNGHGLNDDVERQREALVNCSRAMIGAIRLYGFTAVLDIVVRLSTHDEILNHLLPQLPTIANTTNFLSTNAELNSKKKSVEEILNEIDRAG